LFFSSKKFGEALTHVLVQEIKKVHTKIERGCKLSIIQLSQINCDETSNTRFGTYYVVFIVN
jgi:hypothetical protein